MKTKNESIKNIRNQLILVDILMANKFDFIKKSNTFNCLNFRYILASY